MKKIISAKTREICDRVKALRKTLGISQSDFAVSVGISQGHLCIVERCDQVPTIPFLLAVCHRYKVNEEWLLEGAGETFAPDLSGGGLPIYSRAPDFSEGSTDRGEQIGQIMLPGLPEGAFGICQRGDFMFPTIQAGDVVICDPGYENLVNDDLLLITNKWNTYIVRRYRIIESTAMLTPDNPSYKAFPMDSKNAVVAKVVRILRCVNF